MIDRSSELDNELKFSREQGFFDKSLFIRFLIGFLFALCLFALIHFREVRVEVLELGSIAPSYVVTQVDIDFVDEEATIILKQEAVRDVGKIYQLSEKEIHQRRIEFENFLIYDQNWRKFVQESTFDKIYKSVETVEKVLFQLRFTDATTLNKIKSVHYPASSYYVYIPEETGKPVTLPAKIWDHVREMSFPSNLTHSNEAQVIVGFFQNRPWVIEEDVKAEQALSRKIQSQVPKKYTHLEAGTRIIDQGETVTARHVAMLQAMSKAVNEKLSLWHPLTLLGSLIMTLLLAAIMYAYFQMNYPKVLSSNRKLFLLVTVIIITFALSKAVEFFLLNSKSDLIRVIRYPVLVPIAAILLCSLMNAAIAAFVSAFLTIVLTMALAFDTQGFMIINLAAALVTILSTRSLSRRKEIFIVCAKAWLCCVALILSINFYHNYVWNIGILIDIISTAFFMLVTAILVVGLLPLLESAFKVMTNVTMMEYMDPNNDLLRRLTLEAPGTYQHSVVVGNLAEAAATAIGANGLFCRVATLYHDVGKMITPQYFTENQQPGVNMHQLLTPKESAQVIMAHVPEGVSLARKAGLPEQFIDIIKEHHGTTLVYYFYRKQLDLMGNDKAKVDEREYRYAGPKPRSKESAIIMISDTLEAASRSLDKLDETSLSELATRLIREKAEDGQFDECLLTFEELAIVKAVLVKTLVAFAHARIKYPTRESAQQKTDATAPSSEA